MQLENPKILKPINVVIHIGPNDITKFNYNNVNAEELAHRIINIGLKCKSYGVSNVAVSSILKRNSFNINRVIYQVDNIVSYSFYRCNDLVNENYLWEDGLHLTNEGSPLLLNNFNNFINENVNNNI